MKEGGCVFSERVIQEEEPADTKALRWKQGWKETNSCSQSLVPDRPTLKPDWRQEVVFSFQAAFWAAPLLRLINYSFSWISWVCIQGRNVLPGLLPPQSHPCRDSSPDVCPTEVSGGKCSPGTPDFEFTPRYCVGQWMLTEHRPCSRCQQVPTMGGLQFPQLSGCSVPRTPFKTRPRSLSRSQQGRLWGGAGCVEASLASNLPPHSPSPHFILHRPTGRPPPSESLLLAEGNSLLFVLTQQLLSLWSRSHSLLYSSWLRSFPTKLRLFEAGIGLEPPWGRTGPCRGF